MNRKLQKLDAQLLWHPFTQQQQWTQNSQQNMLVIARAKGVYIYDDCGRRYLDSVSSLWANIYGHRHPALDAAVKQQLGKMAHTSFLGLTHEPGVLLAQALLRLMPKNLTRVFYSDNGSTAVEVALKMAYQYYCQRDQKPQVRTEFLALENGYHGDTIGTVSVGGIGIFHAKFKPLLFKTNFAMSPDCLRCPFRKKAASSVQSLKYEYHQENPRPGQLRRQTGCRWECLGQVEKILKAKHKKMVCAVIEPLLQGAGGMIVMPPGYLKGFASLCKKYDVLWVADEVATGFGRTGRAFACQHEGVQADFVCLSKGITGGYLPLAATLTSEKIYRAFLGRPEEYKTFFHGHTYTANPLACAVALAASQLLTQKKFLPSVQQKAEFLNRELQALLKLPNVGQIRQIGMVAGIELVQDKQTMKNFDVSLSVGRKVCAEAIRRGVWMRLLGDTIVLMPPLVISKAEIKTLVRVVSQSVQAAIDGL